MSTVEEAAKAIALSESIPIDVGVAARQVMAEMAKFMKDYKVFDKAVLPTDGNYGEKLRDLPKNKIGKDNFDRKQWADLQKKYAVLRGKWQQFDQSVWALHIR